MSHTSGYLPTYRRSLESPREFWASAADAVTWFNAPSETLDDSNAPFYMWFPDGTLNTCYNAVDRHVDEGRGDRSALIYDSPVADTQRVLTYTELRDEVAAFAQVLITLGVNKGDRVIIYMPMIPEAVVGMLACARIGAIHSVVFGGFAAPELATRIDDALPSVIIAASCGIEPSRVVEYMPLLERALELAEHHPDAVVVKQRPQAIAKLTRGRDHDWDDLISEGRLSPAGCVDVASTDPLYILYTSGTTGPPKGIVRDNGGHATAMLWSMTNVFDVRDGDIWWAASDVGWVVGHSYIVYGPLLVGATTVLYEGKPVGTPDASSFWRVIAQHKVTSLFTAPTAIRAIRREDPEAELLQLHDTSTLRTLFLAGERLDPDTYAWALGKLGKPVIDNWWQTETGWPIVASPQGLDPVPPKPGSPSVPMPGYDLCVLDEHGVEVDANVEGAICLRLPLPPGSLVTLWQDDERYVDSYMSAFPGYYLTGDGGYVDEEGYVFVMGRTDDVINVAGHRMSTGSLEAVIVQHPDVAESAVIGVADPLKGQVPRVLVVLKSGAAAGDELERDLVTLVRDNIGAIATPKRIDIVGGLPKTRSGKVLRKTMREIADGLSVPVPSTIEDPAVLETLRPLLTGLQ